MAKISASAICARADMNRSTFYAHYEDPFALLEEIEEHFLSALSNSMSENARSNYQGKLEQYLSYIYEHRKIYLILAREDSAFDQKMLAISSTIYSREVVFLLPLFPLQRQKHCLSAAKSKDNL